MCEKCRALTASIAAGEAFLSSHGGVYRRPLTALETQYGDVDRVDEDHNDAEVAIAQTAAPVVRRIAEQLVDEAAALARKADVSGLSRLRPSFTGELVGALRAGIRNAVELGKAQAHDAYARQKGTSLAARRPLRKNVKKAEAYLDAKAEIEAERISAQIASQVQAATVAQVAKNAGTDWIADALDPDNPDGLLAKAIDTGTRALAGTAMSGAREGIGVGRLIVFDEVREEIASVTLTAILDNNVCEVCEALDGTEWTGDDIDEGLASAPVDDCLGGANCRCFTVVVFK